jgi:hypothetical protein
MNRGGRSHRSRKTLASCPLTIKSDPVFKPHRKELVKLGRMKIILVRYEVRGR